METPGAEGDGEDSETKLIEQEHEQDFGAPVIVSARQVYPPVVAGRPVIALLKGLFCRQLLVEASGRALLCGRAHPRLLLQQPL
jgi:hypothetical protein